MRPRSAFAAAIACPRQSLPEIALVDERAAQERARITREPGQQLDRAGERRAAPGWERGEEGGGWWWLCGG